jgi:hypothetical protein
MTTGRSLLLNVFPPGHPVQWSADKFVTEAPGGSSQWRTARSKIDAYAGASEFARALDEMGRER